MKKYLFIILVAVAFVSCSKATETRLIGEWKIESVGDCGWSENAKWTFYSGGKLEITDDIMFGKKDSVQVCSYDVFTRSIVTRYVRIEGSTMNGVWRVEKVNSRKLKLNRVELLDGNTQGAYLRREFTK
ncbi:MAG: hypothetical protein MJ197_00710 [Bacteroidales bacterium]|nr:hypothetical protein [Bacteroidales bacterium]